MAGACCELAMQRVVLLRKVLKTKHTSGVPGTVSWPWKPGQVDAAVWVTGREDEAAAQLADPAFLHRVRACLGLPTAAPPAPGRSQPYKACAWAARPGPLRPRKVDPAACSDAASRLLCSKPTDTTSDVHPAASHLMQPACSVPLISWLVHLRVDYATCADRPAGDPEP